MQSYQDTRRQLRLALTAIAIVLPLGVVGYLVFEQVSLLDALWLTVTTLTTIGYGDVVAKSDMGRIFTIFLVIIGLGSFAVAAQATLAFLISPELVSSRQRRRAIRHIQSLSGHFIVCGEGELVDRTINSLLERVRSRQIHEEEAATRDIDRWAKRLLGQDNVVSRGVRYRLRQLYLMPYRPNTLMQLMVVVTQDTEYAFHLRQLGFTVLEGDSADESVLVQAGLDQAYALMALSSTDTETLMTVLTANEHNPRLFVTAAVLNEQFATKMLRAGANNVIGPFDVAGQFLNNATFRPAVNDFFSSILFDDKMSQPQVVQLFLYDDSPWIGQRLRDLTLRERYEAGVIGIRDDSGQFIYAPDANYQLGEDDVMLVVTKVAYIPDIQNECRAGTQRRDHPATWQPLPAPVVRLHAPRSMALVDAEQTASQMSQHYIICAGGRVAESALKRLDPNRDFVIVSEDNNQTRMLLHQGFCVIHGNPAEDGVLRRAGIQRALAIMVAIEDRALNVLATLTARTLNRHILITATAENDLMVDKLRRAGADRVISPFRIAGQFVLLATLRPIVSDFMQYVLFNRRIGLETTELYMQDDSPWIGRQVKDLALNERFDAGVIGIRLANG